jgi:hypothetical protein
MNLSAKSVERLLKVLEEYRLVAYTSSIDAKRRGLRADFRFHEGRASAFSEAKHAVREVLESGDEAN